MDYNFQEIEKKWQQRWAEQQTYRVSEDPARPKYYVLNMFPYPSGAGLHVGHPLGYIASDIYARYKRQRGYNVLNPMGYDAYGLPAEQYAIQTGQHPEVTTNENIARYRQQLDKIGFSFDWSREVRTCDPAYYHWTQWAFQKMFNSYFDEELQKAQPIERLIEKFKADGTWPADEKAQSDLLMNHRIAFLGETMVNWCPKLGTVLANDEVVEGVSVRGGCSTDWTPSTGAKASRKHSATGLAAPKGQRLKSRPPKASRSPSSPPVPTRCSASPSSSSLPRANSWTR